MWVVATRCGGIWGTRALMASPPPDIYYISSAAELRGLTSIEQSPPKYGFGAGEHETARRVLRR